MDSKLDLGMGRGFQEVRLVVAIRLSIPLGGLSVLIAVLRTSPVCKWVVELAVVNFDLVASFSAG